jgi:hypothetical protein
MTRTVLVFASVVSAVFLLACAKTVVDQIPENETDKTATVPTPTKDAGKDSSTTKKPPAKDDEEPEPTGGVCASETSFETCLDCCSTEHPQGSDTFYGSYVGCLCTSACAAECSLSLCDTANPAAPDFECEDCITTYGSTCQADVAAACNADPDCIAFDKCVGDSQCETKP